MTNKYYAVIWDNSQRKTVWSKGFKTEREAKKQEVRMLHELEEGLLQSSKLKFLDVAKLWTDSSSDTYANSTLQGYIWYLDRYLLPVFGDKKITDISPSHIQKFINEMSKYLSAETVNKNINVLSNIFNHAIMLRILRQNPTKGIKRKKVTLPKCITWSVEQIQSFLSYDRVIHSIYYEMFLLSFTTGMRPSEVCGISYDDVSKDGLLTLTRGYDRYGVVSDMKTSKSHRSIQLNKSILLALEKRLEKQENQMIYTKSNYQENDFLFKQSNGAPINPSVYSKAFKRYLRSYNKNNAIPLPDTSLYSASRHSFGTNLIIDEKVPTSIVSSIMGNSERVLTSRYIHVKDDKQTAVLSTYTNMILYDEV